MAMFCNKISDYYYPPSILNLYTAFWTGFCYSKGCLQNWHFTQQSVNLATFKQPSARFGYSQGVSAKLKIFCKIDILKKNPLQGLLPHFGYSKGCLQNLHFSAKLIFWNKSFTRPSAPFLLCQGVSAILTFFCKIDILIWII